MPLPANTHPCLHKYIDLDDDNIGWAPGKYNGWPALYGTYLEQVRIQAVHGHGVRLLHTTLGTSPWYQKLSLATDWFYERFKHHEALANEARQYAHEYIGWHLIESA